MEWNFGGVAFNSVLTFFYLSGLGLVTRFATKRKSVVINALMNIK